MPFAATLLLAGAPLAAPLSAQGVAGPVRPPTVRASEAPYRSYVGINPLGVPAGFFNAEWERLTSNGLSVGISFAHDETFTFTADDYSDGDDIKETSGELKFRYYPNEGPNLHGFSLGASIGMSRFAGRIYDYRGCQQFGCPPGSVPSTDASEVGATAGVLVDYNWLIGRRKRLLIGLGLGAKRWFGATSEGDDLVYPNPPATLQISRSQPTARFVVGYAF